MLPWTFIVLDELPMTPGGKVDKRSLPTPDPTGVEREASYAAPRTEAEEQLAKIWSDVLGLKKIGIHDNFFTELGALAASHSADLPCARRLSDRITFATSF
jgi:hypothetical protein